MHCSVQVATLLLTPICPHTCEHMWRDILGRPGSVLTAGFPAGKAPDFALKFAAEYLHEEVADLRKLIEKAEAPPKSKKKITPPPPPPAKVSSFPSVSLMAGAPPSTALVWPIQSVLKESETLQTAVWAGLLTLCSWN